MIFFFFYCGPSLRSLLNLLQYCFCFGFFFGFFFFGFFGHEACGILAPQPGTEPILLALEGKVLITRLPGKSLMDFFLPLMSLGGVCLSAPKGDPLLLRQVLKHPSLVASRTRWWLTHRVVSEFPKPNGKKNTPKYSKTSLKNKNGTIRRSGNFS